MTPIVLVDLVIAVLVIETIALVVVVRGRRRPSLAAFLPNLAAGGFLVLAVRAAAGNLGAHWIGLFLALGGAAHGIDLWMRLRKR